ncbi:MAG: L-threonylcarbamoyladenylate synthase [Coriobacteriia bacterium]|nr:L-threonylcarbamoyladenylate synthase [Coriobacteriia bacterium]
MPTGDFDAVVNTLMAGKTAIVPTDTLYGLAVCPLYAASPGVLYEIKGRPSDKPVAWLVGSLSDLDVYGRDVADYARRLATAFWPGALTVIVPASDAVPPAYRSAAGTIGLRMPDDELTRAIITAVGCPLAATSANLSGRPDPLSFAEIDPVIIAATAAAIDDSQKKSGIGSTVIDCTAPTPRILREGSITPEEITAVLG